MSSCSNTSGYLSSSLNSVQIGWSKAQFLQFFPGGAETILPPEAPILRASQRQGDGQIVEVFTLPISSPRDYMVDYWFVFRGGRLEQWGRPEDWQQVSGRYEISFNPSASVR
jgi:hypothetical protein